MLGKKHREESIEKIIIGLKKAHDRGFLFNQKEKINKECLNCSNSFLVHPYREKNAKYCCYDCYYKSKIGKIPNDKVWEKGHKSWNKGLTKETDLRISTYWLGKKRLDMRNLWQNKEYRERVLIKMFEKNKIKPNKPEKILIELIEKNNLPFNYVGNGKIFINGFNPDFLSKNPRKIIELFGDYWHNRKDSKIRDKERLINYSKYGYKTLIIWEHELKDTNEILNKIRKFINE